MEMIFKILFNEYTLAAVYRKALLDAHTTKASDLSP